MVAQPPSPHENLDLKPERGAKAGEKVLEGEKKNFKIIFCQINPFPLWFACFFFCFFVY